MKKKRITLRNTGTNEDENLQYNFTLEQAFDYFVSAKKAEGTRKNTVRIYYENFGIFSKWFRNEYPDYTKANDLTTPIIREYLNYLKEERFNLKTKEYGLSDQTLNARLRFLKTFYNFLHKEDIVSENPAEKIKLIRMDERKFTPLTEEEMVRLMSIPDKKQYPQFRDFVLMNLLYDTAMRIFEAVHITVDDLDLKGRRILLPAEITKGRKTRIIPLSNHVIKLLIELISENEANFENKSIFLNWYGEQLNEDTFRRNLKRYLNKANIDKQFSCHDFRRQSITEMLKNGASIWAVQSICGHSQITTTKKYVHFDEQTIKNQHELYSPVVKMRINNKRK
ncbi:tyrosine-type recombinase/integrase [Heyndrickxia acidicola]|uniref:Tyrosine-type recombinase/integrase n=1 Tax=Heyndrickxia acidicola TaxID=209389 RepID=A0ABU6MSG3_9BACI|nr:tyrosine-type recombinase/integrase [Heyndrickxia acidicola]MED1206147.1 tyrosine-type recombinase/integrase [Heyndrickxia acidicola]